MLCFLVGNSKLSDFHCFIEDIVSSSASYYEMKLVDKVSLPIEGKGKETFKKNIGGLS